MARNRCWPSAEHSPFCRPRHVSPPVRSLHKGERPAGFSGHAICTLQHISMPWRRGAFELPATCIAYSRQSRELSSLRRPFVTEIMCREIHITMLCHTPTRMLRPSAHHPNTPRHTPWPSSRSAPAALGLPQLTSLSSWLTNQAPAFAPMQLPILSRSSAAPHCRLSRPRRARYPSRRSSIRFFSAKTTWACTRAMSGGTQSPRGQTGQQPGRCDAAR